MTAISADPLDLLETIAEPVPEDVLAATPPEVRQRIATLGHATAALLRMIRVKGETEAGSNKLADEIDRWSDNHLA